MYIPLNEVSLKYKPAFFEPIKLVSNETLEATIELPDSLNFLSVKNDKYVLYCKWILPVGLYYIGEFYSIEGDFKYTILVTFAQEGSIIDILLLKHAQKVDEKWSNFFSRHTYDGIDNINVLMLDATTSVRHPSQAKTLSTDKWIVDKSTGKFKREKRYLTSGLAHPFRRQ